MAVPPDTDDSKPPGDPQAAPAESGGPPIPLISVALSSLERDAQGNPDSQGSQLAEMEDLVNKLLVWVYSMFSGTSPFYKLPREPEPIPNDDDAAKLPLAGSLEYIREGFYRTESLGFQQ